MWYLRAVDTAANHCTADRPQTAATINAKPVTNVCCSPAGFPGETLGDWLRRHRPQACTPGSGGLGSMASFLTNNRSIVSGSQPGAPGPTLQAASSTAVDAAVAVSATAGSTVPLSSAATPVPAFQAKPSDPAVDPSDTLAGFMGTIQSGLGPASPNGQPMSAMQRPPGATANLYRLRQMFADPALSRQGSLAVSYTCLYEAACCFVSASHA